MENSEVVMSKARELIESAIESYDDPEQEVIFRSRSDRDKALEISGRLLARSSSAYANASGDRSIVTGGSYEELTPLLHSWSAAGLKFRSRRY